MRRTVSKPNYRCLVDLRLPGRVSHMSSVWPFRRKGWPGWVDLRAATVSIVQCVTHCHPGRLCLLLSWGSRYRRRNGRTDAPLLEANLLCDGLLNFVCNLWASWTYTEHWTLQRLASQSCALSFTRCYSRSNWLFHQWASYGDMTPL